MEYTVEDIATRIHDMCWQSERDGAINSALWILNHCKISDKDYEMVSNYLSKEYEFYIDD